MAGFLFFLFFFFLHEKHVGAFPFSLLVSSLFFYPVTEFWLLFGSIYFQTNGSVIFKMASQLGKF